MSLLYLLRQNPDGGPGSIETEGRYWNLATCDLDAPDFEDSPFICVSYTWGLAEVASPFHPSKNISDRTIPALNAVMRHRPSCTGVWIDAFCVPVDELEKTHTLESMGYIYSVPLKLLSSFRALLVQFSKR